MRDRFDQDDLYEYFDQVRSSSPRRSRALREGPLAVSTGGQAQAAPMGIGEEDGIDEELQPKFKKLAQQTAEEIVDHLGQYEGRFAEHRQWLVKDVLEFLEEFSVKQEELEGEDPSDVEA